jgi:apolipoprotein N-acyltransferase
LKTKARDVLLAISSGALTALAFPKFGLSFLAWISLLPLLLLVLKRTPRRSFWLGLAAGFVFYGILVYWIPSVPVHYGGLSPALSILVYLILILFLSLSWGLFGFFSARLGCRFPRTGFLLVPFVWISLEYILTYILTGFPWGLLGYTQYKNIPFIQLASLTGIYGLSFVLVFFQSGFVYSFVSRKRSPFFSS